MNDTPPTPLERVRKVLAREKLQSEWKPLQEDRKDKLIVYQAEHPGLVAMRVYVAETELQRADTFGTVRKNQLRIGVAISRNLLEEKTGFSWHIARANRGRAGVRSYMILPIEYGSSSKSTSEIPLENATKELPKVLPLIARSFKGIGAKMHEPFLNLADLLKSEVRFGHTFSYDASRRYSKEDSEFIFVEGISHIYA